LTHSKTTPQYRLLSGLCLPTQIKKIILANGLTIKPIWFKVASRDFAKYRQMFYQ
jgi:hypothetical protein